MSRKFWKRSAKKQVKVNYGRCFVVCFLVTLLIGGTLINVIQETKTNEESIIISFHSIEGKTNTDIVNEFLTGIHKEEYVENQSNGFLGSIFNSISKSGSFLFGILNVTNQFLFQDRIVSGFIIIIGIFIGVIYWIFISKLLEVGRCRFFLENRLYSKTRMNRVLLPFRVRKSTHISLVMLRKNIYQFFWFFTIIGGPIKIYAYRMVPYLLAENPNLTGKEAILLSRNMMHHHKWEAFLLDCSFLGYFILGMFTLNLFNLFYTNLYHHASYAEYYIYLRKIYGKDHKEILFDFYLDHNLEQLNNYPEEKYPLKQHKSRDLFQSLDYERRYTFSSYLFLFFCFGIIGWLWEVLLFLFSEGIFVNRGALYGPWLPIYGSGGVLILFLLQKIRKKPWLTFILIILICGIVEYGTAFYLETFKHLKWWDYTGYFMNLHGRICLEGLLFFGIGGLALIYFLAPLLDQFFKTWKLSYQKWICIVLLIFFLGDFFYSSKYPHTGENITKEINLNET